MNTFEKNTDYRFRKIERLSSKKTIQELFDNGSSFYLFPFKVVYIPCPEQAESNQVLFSVPKRHFKRAVDRNRIKRQLKEAYRLNKSILSNSEVKICIGYIYTFKEKLPYQKLEEQLKESLKRLYQEAKKLNEIE